jgi:hypothetical protein
MLLMLACRRSFQVISGPQKDRLATGQYAASDVAALVTCDGRSGWREPLTRATARGRLADNGELAKEEFPMDGPGNRLDLVNTAIPRGVSHRAQNPDRRKHNGQTEPWSSTVLLLAEMAQYGLTGVSVVAASSGNTHGMARSAASVANAGRAPSASRNVRVSFVERLGDKSVSITWRDSTEACYSEQHWLKKMTRRPGVCALSGVHIARGDCVYGPVSRTARRPLNCAQMVLATVLESLERREAFYAQP